MTRDGADRVVATHRITVDLPVAQCQRLFTPAGEALWVDGWQPRYLSPADGHTQPGMLFTTGQADESTVWVLEAYTQNPWRACYARITPASRWGHVEVCCEPLDDDRTAVQVTYTMHALTPAGAQALQAFAPAPYAEMIEGWKHRIDGQLERLRDARIP